MIHDEAGKHYWDKTYQRAASPRALDPHDRGIRNYSKRQFHEFLSKALVGMHGRNLLEIGCGDSVFLPYFSNELGLNVSGIDYSEAGCEKASGMLVREGVSGEVVCADVFCPPARLLGKFDVVVSFGVVEHFVETAECLSAFARFLKPGGTILTFVPNMNGLMGRLQKLLDSKVYAKHIPLDHSALRQAHEQAGLSVLHCDYFQFNNFFVPNINEVTQGSLEWYVKSAFLKLLHYASGVIWLLEMLIRPFSPNGFVSPFIICTATLVSAPRVTS
jgi:2-polyprenyl-3-methyl-5-hydroxy-6-metoxy-1,4-benzoquinol methylase